jgi:formylmethanofuran dehydrogenase subunit C
MTLTDCFLNDSSKSGGVEMSKHWQRKNVKELSNGFEATLENAGKEIVITFPKDGIFETGPISEMNIGKVEEILKAIIGPLNKATHTGELNKSTKKGKN